LIPVIHAVVELKMHNSPKLKVHYQTVHSKLNTLSEGYKFIWEGSKTAAKKLVGLLGDKHPLHKNRLYQGQCLGWRFSSTRLRMATSQSCCLFVQWWPKWEMIGKAIMLVPTTGWKLDNHHKTYLAVQC